MHGYFACWLGLLCTLKLAAEVSKSVVVASVRVRVRVRVGVRVGVRVRVRVRIRVKVTYSAATQHPLSRLLSYTPLPHHRTSP